MNELQFAEDVLARIRARGGQYHERSYLFVLAAIALPDAASGVLFMAAFSAGTDVIEALRGCKVAMRPHRFTLQTREAADEDH